MAPLIMLFVSLAVFVGNSIGLFSSTILVPIFLMSTLLGPSQVPMAMASEIGPLGYAASEGGVNLLPIPESLDAFVEQETDMESRHQRRDLLAQRRLTTAKESQNPAVPFDADVIHDVHHIADRLASEASRHLGFDKDAIRKFYFHEDGAPAFADILASLSTLVHQSTGLTLGGLATSFLAEMNASQQTKQKPVTLGLSNMDPYNPRQRPKGPSYLYV